MYQILRTESFAAQIENNDVIIERIWMTKIYVVNKIGWEYNDEYYYRPQSGGGLPEHAFTNLDDAKKYCDQKNLEFYKTTPIRDYMEGDMYDFFSKEGTKLMSQFFGEDWRDILDDTYNICWDMTDEQWMQLLPHLEIVLYEICEVECE